MSTLKSIDKTDIIKQLEKTLDKYSSKELTDKEIQSLLDKDKNVKLYLKYLEDFKTSSASNEDIFVRNFIDFMSKSLDLEQDDFHQIFLIYLLLTASYVTDFFNTKDLQDKKKHIKNIKKIFIESTLNVIKTYEYKLTQTIQKVQRN
jgi:hypothetical protein